MWVRFPPSPPKVFCSSYNGTTLNSTRNPDDVERSHEESGLPQVQALNRILLMGKTRFRHGEIAKKATGHR